MSIRAHSDRCTFLIDSLKTLLKMRIIFHFCLFHWVFLSFSALFRIIHDGLVKYGEKVKFFCRLQSLFVKKNAINKDGSNECYNVMMLGINGDAATAC